MSSHEPKEILETDGRGHAKVSLTNTDRTSWRIIEDTDGRGYAEVRVNREGDDYRTKWLALPENK